MNLGCTKQPTADCKNDKEDDPHFVVTCPEIAHVVWLKIAHLGAAFLLCVAGLRVLLCVFPSVVQQEQHSREHEQC